MVVDHSAYLVDCVSYWFFFQIQFLVPIQCVGPLVCFQVLMFPSLLEDAEVSECFAPFLQYVEDTHNLALAKGPQYLVRPSTWLDLCTSISLNFEGPPPKSSVHGLYTQVNCFQ